MQFIHFCQNHNVLEKLKKDKISHISQRIKLCSFFLHTEEFKKLINTVDTGYNVLEYNTLSFITYSDARSLMK